MNDLVTPEMRVWAIKNGIDPDSEEFKGMVALLTFISLISGSQLR